MALQKQNININFAQGLDTKTDPFQVQPGKFLSLVNSIFTKGGLLQKRNGFGNLTSLPDTSYSTINTFNGNLTALGSNLAAYSQGSDTWITKGTIRSLDLSVLPLVRSAINQTQCDSVVSDNGLSCTVYTDNNNGTVSYKYVIADATTGQNIVSPTLIPPSAGTVTGSPRVFLLGSHFVITFNTVIAATNHIQFVAISTITPTTITTAVDITAQYTATGTPGFDGLVVDNNLYFAWNGSDGGGAVRVTYIDHTLFQHNTVVYAGRTATMFSLAADTSANVPVIYVSFYSPSDGYVLAVNNVLAPVLAPTRFIVSETVLNLAATATSGVFRSYYEVSNNYGYDAGIPTHFIKTNTVTQAGTVGTSSVLVRSVGLASKAFTVNSVDYFLAVYYSVFQPTYFLINGSGQVIAKFAYENAGGYITLGLPSALVVDETVKIAYLFKDLITSVNKAQGVANAAGIYSQTGINMATMIINNDSLNVAEIGNNLNMSGGILWAYDGITPTEQEFHLWPDNVEATFVNTGGSMTAQQYFYQATYEWTDAQGNIFRSAPSIPITITTGGTATATINVPTMRLTYKITNPIKIVLYRWSAAQQNYYQVTSITAPTLNSTTVDYVSITDTSSDAQILGNQLLYTTGGVVENIPPSACIAPFLFDDRLFAISAEDRNLLLFSKQIIEGTPVEMSDLFSMFVAPTLGAQGSTGPLTCGAPMDDKAILFKADAIYYFNGTGPDNTGANNQYSQPIFVTTTVGCANPDSIVMTPNGLMFQSDKGIWILKRDLSTEYIGAPVEQFNNDTVRSAINVYGTNQVRFTLDSGVTLMYDYYYGQWGTFEGIPGISSVLYQGLHTFINQYGQVLQETAGTYLDGSNPVLLSFTTSWFNLAGLQGYIRSYFFFLLGVYYSPHKLNLQIAYDYNSSPEQSTLITPNNFTPTYGDVSPYGQESPYGGVGNIEQWRVFLSKQRCQAFQITLNEVFDASFGVAVGQGLTLSGLNLVYAMKKGYTTISNAKSAGG